MELCLKMKDYNAENNRVAWFDIPLAALSKAQKFYESVLNIKIFRDKYKDFEFCVLKCKNLFPKRILPCINYIH